MTYNREKLLSPKITVHFRCYRLSGMAFRNVCQAPPVEWEMGSLGFTRFLGQ